ncbi:MAG TPA: hypothetical protein VIM69_01440 [Opitutaceae bacterium]
MKLTFEEVETAEELLNALRNDLNHETDPQLREACLRIDRRLFPIHSVLTKLVGVEEAAFFHPRIP